MRFSSQPSTADRLPGGAFLFWTASFHEQILSCANTGSSEPRAFAEGEGEVAPSLPGCCGSEPPGAPDSAKGLSAPGAVKGGAEPSRGFPWETQPDTHTQECSSFPVSWQVELWLFGSEHYIELLGILKGKRRTGMMGIEAVEGLWQKFWSLGAARNARQPQLLGAMGKEVEGLF